MKTNPRHAPLSINTSNSKRLKGHISQNYYRYFSTYVKMHIFISPLIAPASITFTTSILKSQFANLK